VADAPVAHDFVVITGANVIGLAFICQLLLHSVASRDLISDATIRASQHVCQGVGSTDYCVNQVVPQLVMYQPD